MKSWINNLIDWFETKFNFIIDILALAGGAFCIIFSAILFLSLLSGGQGVLDGIEVVLLPGFIGFIGVMILFALRITRHLTRKEDN